MTTRDSTGEAIAQVRRLVEDLRARLHMAERALGMLEHLGTAEAQGVQVAQASGGSKANGGPYAEMSGPAAAEKILQAAGRPLHIRKIVEGMVAGGFRTNDARRLETGLYANLKRQPHRFRKVEPGIFALVSNEGNYSLLKQG